MKGERPFEAYYVGMNVLELDTPSLIVDLDRLEKNIALMAAVARDGGKALRPHTKTHKTPEIAALQLDAGAAGLTVAKLGEAEVYADRGFRDIFVANELIGSHKIERLMALSEQCRVIVGVDSWEGAAPIAQAARGRGVRIPVRVEIDTGLGRAGVRSISEAVELGRRISETPGLELEGIFTHEGYVYKVEESARPAHCRQAAEKLRHVKHGLETAGIEIRSMSVGSTPGAEHMAREEEITELRPGVYVVGDVMQTGLGFDPNDCALSVLAAVVSRPDSATAIVDSGTKAMSGDRAPEGSKHGVIAGHPDALFDWANEEHGHIDLTNCGWSPSIGEKVRIIPYHACAAMNMHDEVVAVRDEIVEGIWIVAARGKFR